MLIELSQLPPIIQEQILTAKAGDVLQVVQNGQIVKQYTASDDEQAYYEWFYRHHFDVAYLKEAIGKTDENGRAKNTVTVPDGIANDKEKFRAWLMAGL